MTAVTRPWALLAIAIVDADRGLVSDPINKIRRRRSPLVRHGQDSRRAWDRLKLGRYREMNQEIDRNEHCRHKNPGQRPHYLRARPFGEDSEWRTRCREHGKSKCYHEVESAERIPDFKPQAAQFEPKRHSCQEQEGHGAGDHIANARRWREWRRQSSIEIEN